MRYFVFAIAGGVFAGYLLARAYMRLTVSVNDVPSSIVLQFAGTFGVWILAEHLHLSAIVTVVVFGITTARDAPRTGAGTQPLAVVCGVGTGCVRAERARVRADRLAASPDPGCSRPCRTSRVFPDCHDRAGHLRRRSIRMGVQLLRPLRD